MNVAAAARIATRELRGGLAGFQVFLLCLTLGVAAIAAVGSVRFAIEQGLQQEGATLLGGDAEMEFTYRYASDAERAWMTENATRVSEVVDFRSMAVVEDPSGGTERGLTQVKAVDDVYPLRGAVQLSPDIPLETALAGDTLPGAVVQRVLADRLGLAVGDTFKLGLQEFRLTALLEAEPDASSAGFSLGPRSIVLTRDLAGSGLLEPGTLFESKYRLELDPDRDLVSTKDEALELFRDSGLRWRDSRNGAPGVREFVERVGAFLVLVGLAGLAVGGVGVSASVRAYLMGKTATIATLRTLGADGATIFAAYLFQIGALAVVGISAGVLLGGSIPVLLGPLIEAQLPVPIAIGFYPRALFEAALYGALTALIFTLWPLARTEQVRAATLYRDGGAGALLPRPIYLAVSVALVALLVGAAALFSGVPMLAAYTAGGIIGALFALALSAVAVRWLARKLARLGVSRGRPALRWALAAIGGPREEAVAIVLSLGLGLTVLSAVGQIDTNLRNAIQGDLPDVAPSYFFVDIQPDQLPGFLERLEQDAAVSRVDTAPMLRGILTRINGVPAREVAGEHWVLQGDRGVTYTALPGEETIITDGAWWPEDYNGPPQVSFAEEEAAELGLELGDMITINILGRDIEAEITSFRVVDFSTAGIAFILAMNPSALAGAPHTHIATVYAEEAAEAAILRDLASAYPNITAIRVRDAIDNVASVLAGLAAATSYGAGATLITGFVVLLGAAAAGERARIHEAALLKTLGATRWRILFSFALRSALLGAAAGMVAMVAGGVGAWAVITRVMEADFSFDWTSASVIVLGGVVAVLLAGLAFVWRALKERPARVLRASE